MNDRTGDDVIELLELYPDHTQAEIRFNVQPDGRAAIAVSCRGATPDTEIVFDTVGLPTVFVSETLLTAYVPSELYRRPACLSVHLRADRVESNSLVFQVQDNLAWRLQPESTPSSRRLNHNPRILICVLHFGVWPEWLPCFLETCRWNRTIDWLIITDCETPAVLPDNVRVRPETLVTLQRRIEEKLQFAVSIEDAYKLCDFRLAFPRIFDDLAIGYELFGWSDLDVIYGDIRRLLSREALANDVITFYEQHLAGHLTLVRNSTAMLELHLQVPHWEAKVRLPEYQHLDEPAPDLIRLRFPVWAKQSYNTPLSPYAAWRDGTFKFPTEWYWTEGRLTNDLDGDLEFLYLHFMHWKGGPWPRACGNAQWERLDHIVHVQPQQLRSGFRVNERGFFAL